ncbi:cbb3-type cytochrome oxidase assembly protein CcoS [Mesorhizobium sp. VNQ89]|uniref:cbb3-type cytochrome oxidase assembly protein CcoS n=1 Tax=Mesorhizobium quangtriensis TaxID=3157709 RepID=UPI0032B750FA
MMDLAMWLVPVGLGMGAIGLLAFLWSMRSGQLDDLEGAAERVLHQSEDAPLRQDSRMADTKR